MKSVFLLRHAKATTPDSGIGDFDRPLTDRGLRDARRMGKFARKLRINPEVILSSPAVRARQTADAFLSKARCNASLEIASDLYMAGADLLGKALAQHANATRIILIAHNPGLEDFIGEMIGAPNASFHFPTGAMARIDYQYETLENVPKIRGTLIWLIHPAVIKAS